MGSSQLDYYRKNAKSINERRRHEYKAKAQKGSSTSSDKAKNDKAIKRKDKAKVLSSEDKAIKRKDKAKVLSSEDKAIKRKIVSSVSPIPNQHLNQANAPRQSMQHMHRLKRSIRIDALYTHIKGFKEVKEWRNSSQELMHYQGLTLRHTSSLLICEGIELVSDYGVVAENLKLYCEKQADATLHNAEREFNLKLDWSTVRTTIFEYAFTEQSYIKDLKKQGEKGRVSFYENPQTGQVEVYGDVSDLMKQGELETIRMTHAGKIRALLKPVLEDKWNPAMQKERDAKLDEVILQIAEALRDAVEAQKVQTSENVQLGRYLREIIEILKTR